MTILFISFAPIILILIYIYYRDKYEKEPIGLLAKAIAGGAVITLPVIFIEIGLGKLVSFTNTIAIAFYDGFIVAAFTEELFKYLAFILLIWRNRNFNELFDGIVYATFISLGFAAVENFFYVFGSGEVVGILRAFTAVPAHALFGITMGYYLGIAKFSNENLRVKYLWLAILIPILLHGIYDFLLMSENGWLLLLFLPFIVYLWISGFRKMKAHVKASAFKNGEKDEKIDLGLGEDELE